MRKVFALALGLTAPALFAADGNSATKSAEAAVVIYAPVTLNAAGTLNFGKVVITDITASAAVTLNAAAAASYVNCAAFSGAAKITATVPTFSGTKDDGLDVGVTMSATMQDCTIALVPQANIVHPGTTFSFPVFGTLTIPAGVLGTKTGTVSVTVAYL